MKTAEQPSGDATVYLFLDPSKDGPQILQLHATAKMDLSKFIPAAEIHVTGSTNAMAKAHEATQGNWTKNFPKDQIYHPQARSSRRGDLYVVDNKLWIDAGVYYAPMEGHSVVDLLYRLPDPYKALSSVVNALSENYGVRLSVSTNGIKTPEMEPFCLIDGWPNHKDQTQGSTSPVMKFNKDTLLTADRLLARACEKVDGLTRLEQWAKCLSLGRKVQAENFAVKPIPTFDPFDL